MRIAIAEDNPILLENLRLLLQGEQGCEVAGAWNSAEEALAFDSWSNIDILLADLDLPGMSGVDLIREIKIRYPFVECMAFTISEDRVTVLNAIQAGACGYLLKGSTPRELIEALHDLHNGGAPMSPKIARKVIHQFQESFAPAPEGACAVGLTHREQDVLGRIERGQSYKEVGIALGISSHTVHSHIKHIYEKLHSRSRSEVLRKARQRGWV